jgi:hypothetical protein
VITKEKTEGHLIQYLKEVHLLPCSQSGQFTVIPRTHYSLSAVAPIKTRRHPSRKLHATRSDFKINFKHLTKISARPRVLTLNSSPCRKLNNEVSSTATNEVSRRSEQVSRLVIYIKISILSMPATKIPCQMLSAYLSL